MTTETPSPADTIRLHFEPGFTEDDKVLAAVDALEERIRLLQNLYDELFAQTEQLRVERDTALESFAASYEREQQAIDALQNLSDDAAELEAQDLRLHDLEQRLGAMLLGFGGGFNHLDDIREALVKLGEQRADRIRALVRGDASDVTGVSGRA